MHFCCEILDIHIKCQRLITVTSRTDGSSSRICSSQQWLGGGSSLPSASALSGYMSATFHYNRELNVKIKFIIPMKYIGKKRNETAKSVCFRRLISYNIYQICLERFEHFLNICNRPSLAKLLNCSI